MEKIWQSQIGYRRLYNTVQALYVMDTDTHSEYVILTDFLLPQWLHERDTVLRYNTLAVFVLVI